MPRSGYTHTLATNATNGFDNAYQRLTPSPEATITLDKSCNALLLSAETATVYVSFDDTAASATNGLPIVVGQPVCIPLGSVAHSSGKIRLFSATGVIHVLQLS